MKGDSSDIALLTRFVGNFSDYNIKRRSNLEKAVRELGCIRKAVTRYQAEVHWRCVSYHGFAKVPDIRAPFTFACFEAKASETQGLWVGTTGSDEAFGFIYLGIFKYAQNHCEKSENMFLKLKELSFFWSGILLFSA